MNSDARSLDVPDGTEPSHRPPRRSRRWLLVTGMGAVGALVAGGAAVGFGGRRRRPKPGPPPRATAPVRRMTLVEGQDFPAEVAYDEEAPLAVRLSGTVTALPDPGTVLRPGDVACRIDDRPVLLLAGSTPAYRTMRVGDRGPDVRQLEKNLRDLGYGGFTVDDTFTASTAGAVRRWQERLGLEQTGSVELGRVVFRPRPARVGAHRIQVGMPVGDALYDLTGTERRVILSLDPKYQHLASKDRAATVLLSDGSTPGVISAVRKPGGGDEPKATVTIQVKDQKALAEQGDTPIEVRLVAREQADVLAVPIVALLAIDGGRYGVEVVDGGTAVVVPVEVGLFAQGQVEISGPGITEGTEVTVPATDTAGRPQ
ncbi:peptidoglycan-binding domain-containing protein [Polymorphospora sp. NPDC051019]|uniref:peptidoglycan-binding domain-containing protein n=1 Tax=Polymorphospora sp. NPDC051019 TaxID=3155725 RepID=UPI00343CAFAA